MLNDGNAPDECQSLSEKGMKNMIERDKYVTHNAMSGINRLQLAGLWLATHPAVSLDVKRARHFLGSTSGFNAHGWLFCLLRAV